MSNLTIFRDMFDVFNDFWITPFDYKKGYSMPAIDVFEKDNQVILEAEMPGIEPKNVKISIDKNVLSLNYKEQEEKKEEGKKYYRVERRANSFYRSFILPETAQQDEISADYKNGILSIKIPKIEKKNKIKEIPIKT